MRHRPRARRRHGASLVETTIVLVVFLILLLGMAELVNALVRSQAVCRASRQGARLASVHGALASAQTGSWGPQTYGPVSGTDATPLAQGMAPYLNGLDPSTVTITAQWPDGDNQPGSRVSVTATTTYQPIVTYLFGTSTWSLSATSTMPISH